MHLLFGNKTGTESRVEIHAMTLKEIKEVVEEFAHGA